MNATRSSLSGGLFKIGCTTSLPVRESQIRSDGYGGFSDWRIISAAAVSEMGMCEAQVMTTMESVRTASYYIRRGDLVLGKEVFQTSLDTVRTAFWATVDFVGSTNRWERSDIDHFHSVGVEIALHD